MSEEKYPRVHQGGIVRGEMSYNRYYYMHNCSRI